ncbi:hypothetical protein ACOME3_009666 [Neoechinorhynchus agilis]
MEEGVVLKEFKGIWSLCLDEMHRCHSNLPLDCDGITTKNSDNIESNIKHKSLKCLLKRHRLSRARWIQSYRLHHGYQLESPKERRTISATVRAEKGLKRKRKIAASGPNKPSKGKISINIRTQVTRKMEKTVEIRHSISKSNSDFQQDSKSKPVIFSGKEKKTTSKADKQSETQPNTSKKLPLKTALDALSNPVVYGMVLHNCVTNPAMRYMLPFLLKRPPNTNESLPPPPPSSTITTSATNTLAGSNMYMTPGSRNILNNTPAQRMMANNVRPNSGPVSPLFPILRALPLTRAHISPAVTISQMANFEHHHHPHYLTPRPSLLHPSTSLSYEQLNPSAITRSKKQRRVAKRRLPLFELRSKVQTFMSDISLDKKGSLETASSTDDDEDEIFHDILTAHPPPPPRAMPLSEIMNDCADLSTFDLLLVLRPSDRICGDVLPHIRTHITFENDHTNGDELSSDVDKLRDVVLRMERAGIDVGLQLFMGRINPPIVLKGNQISVNPNETEMTDLNDEKEDGEISDDDVEPQESSVACKSTKLETKEMPLSGLK